MTSGAGVVLDATARPCLFDVVSKGELTRETIVVQGAEIASRIGLAALTIGQLAGRVEMSKSGLFGHFRSKEILQLRVLEYARERFAAQVVRPALRVARGEPRVRTLFENWLACGRRGDPSCLFLSAVMEYDDQPGVIHDELVSAHRDLMDAIVQVFRTGIAEGDFRRDADPDQFAQDLYGVMLAFAYSHRLLRDAAAETRTRRAFEALLGSAR